MIVDTSVWVDHLRRGKQRLGSLLRAGVVSCHPFIIGELACGTLRRRQEIISLLQALPEVPVVGHEEVLHFVEARRLMGSGIGWIDAHLLASALFAGTSLWTLDLRLERVAASVGVSAS